MAKRIELLLNNNQLRKFMRINASEDAKKRFSQKLMVNRYLNYYNEIIENWKQIV